MSKVFMDAADPIIIEDLEGIIIYANGEAVRSYGWSREEMLGNSVEMLMPRDGTRAVAGNSAARCRNARPCGMWKRHVSANRVKSARFC